MTNLKKEIFRQFWNILIYLGRMDSVEDQGEDQRQDEGHPASQEKVRYGNILSPDDQISAGHNCQDSQTGENILISSLQINLQCSYMSWRQKMMKT